LLLQAIKALTPAKKKILLQAVQRLAGRPEEGLRHDDGGYAA